MKLIYEETAKVIDSNFDLRLELVLLPTCPLPPSLEDMFLVQLCISNPKELPVKTKVAIIPLDPNHTTVSFSSRHSSLSTLRTQLITELTLSLNDFVCNFNHLHSVCTSIRPTTFPMDSPAKKETGGDESCFYFALLLHIWFDLMVGSGKRNGKFTFLTTLHLVTLPPNQPIL